jgi:hypothetical protein
MRKLIVLGTVLLTGCVGVVGPFKRASLQDPVNDRCLTIQEQERKARDRLAIPDNTATTDAPITGLDPPSIYRYGR